MEATTETAPEPVDGAAPAADTNPVAQMFKKDFVDANPGLFDGASNVTEWAEGQLAKQKALVLPEKPSEADLTAYREAMGLPEKAEGYEIDESLGVGKEDIDLVRKVAHEHNFTANQASAFASALAAKDKAFGESVETERTHQVNETKESLAKTYGEAAEAKMELAKSVVKRFGGEEHAKFLDDSSLGNNIRHVEMMIKIGEAISEDTLDSGGSGPMPNTKDGLISFPNTPGME